MYGRGGNKLEINIPLQQIFANSKGGLIIEGGIMSSEYGKFKSGFSLVYVVRYSDFAKEHTHPTFSLISCIG